FSPSPPPPAISPLSLHDALPISGIPGILDVYAPPITNGVNLRVQIKKHYQGQPKQIAAALWGNSAAQYRYKHVIVVEEDIDPARSEEHTSELQSQSNLVCRLLLE